MNTNQQNQSCPKCGAAIPAEAPQGLCPKCVMSGVATEAGAVAPEVGPSDLPSLGRVAGAFSNLEVIELIGRGGMGFVFKARQPHLDRFVALKLLPDKLAKDPQFTERFNREGKVLAKLNHPNIVSVYDFGRTDDFYFLMMEYVDGVNLRQAMRAGRFSPQEALSVVPNICEALQYAHDQGILHRDIKPENILLDTKGSVKIVDFGIAKLVGEDNVGNVTLTNTGCALGTPHYMAPEQWEKPSEVDHRADIYSLGVVLYEMLTGELPIGRFEAPSSKTPVSKGMDDVVFRALEKNRERRQNSAGEFKTQMQTAGAGEVPPQMHPKTPVAPSHSRTAIVGAGLVGFSLLAALFFLMILRVTRGGVAFFEMLIVVGPVGLCALVGTILGWVGLSEIRRGNGARLGLPMALFAAVTYPVGLAALIIVAFPSLFAFQAGSGPNLLVRVLIFLLIAGLLSTLGWSVVAIARWAANNPRGRHWNTRGWLITTGVITLALFLLTVSLQPTGGRRQGQSSVSEVNAFRALRDAAALPAGAVELTALSRHPSEGAWWRADGSPWTNAPFGNPDRAVTPNPQQKAVEMVFRLPGVADPSPRIDLRIAGSTGSSSGNAVIQNDKPLPGSYFVSALFPKEQVTTTVSVGVAEGAWETLAEEGSRSQASLSLSRHGRPINLKFLGALENKQGATVLTVSHDVEDAEVRLVAVMTGGQEKTSLLVDESSGHLTSTFTDTALESIVKFQFQIRSFRWTIFEDVALEPREGSGGVAALSLPGVRVTFDEISLRWEGLHERLELHYTRVDNNAELSWNTDGSFHGAAVDVVNSARIKAGSTGEAADVRHTTSLLLPPDLNRDELLRVLRVAREKWEGNSLVLHPGDEHDLLAVTQPHGNKVTLKLAGRPAKNP